MSATPGNGPTDRQPATAPHGLPRWVKVFIAVTLLVVVVGVIAMLAGHGPGQHGAAPATAGPAPGWTSLR